MPLDAVKDLAREVVEASTEFGSTAANRPRLQDGLVALVGQGGGSVRSVNEVEPTDDNPSFPGNIVLTAADIPAVSPFL